MFVCATLLRVSRSPLEPPKKTVGKTIGVS